jgi:hypothetical protein
MEIESDGAIPFLDVLVIQKGMALSTTVNRKPTHTGSYLIYSPNHLLHLKSCLIQSLHIRA